MANSKMIFWILIAVLVIFGVICIWNNKFDKPSSKEGMMLDDRVVPRSVEYVQPPQYSYVTDQNLGNDYIVLPDADLEEAYNLSMGVGPGLLFHGRHTSEMIGN